MKIAVLSDIHGNNSALKAVLLEAKNQKIEKLLILGDIVGYYYHPDKVLELLSEWSFLLIKGNHEQMLEDVLSRKINLKNIKSEYGSALEMATYKLSDNQIHQLISLPEKIEVEVQNLKISLCHGAPWEADTYVYPDDLNSLNRLDEIEADFIFMGHTHYPFCRRTAFGICANPGSVGQNRDKGGVASWLVLDTTTKSITFKSTAYNPNPIINEVKTLDPAVPYLHQVLVRN